MFLTDAEELEYYAEIRRRQLGIVEEEMIPSVDYVAKYAELKALLEDYLSYSSMDGNMKRQVLRKRITELIR